MNTKLLYFITTIITLNLYAQKNRPQEPKEPFGYTSENVVFKNNLDNISLAGTLTYPKKGF